MKRRFALFPIILSLFLCACPSPVDGNSGPGATESPGATPAPTPENAGSGTKADPFVLIVNTPSTKQSPGSTPLYFTFTIEEGGFFDIELSCPSSPGMAFSAILYSDPGMTAIKGVSTSTTTGLSDLELPAGGYYLMAGPHSTQSTSFTVTVRRKGDLKYEGSKSDPVSLTVGTPHQGKADALSYMEDKRSYYSFAVPSDGVYSISTTNVTNGQNLAVMLYSSNLYDFNSTVTTVFNSNAGIPQAGCRTGTMYLTVYSYGSAACTYDITVSRVGDYPAEGSVASPVELTLDVDYSGKVGSIVGTMNSYYRFTVVDAGLYDIDATGLSNTLYFYLYASPDFTGSSMDMSTTNGLTDCQLSAGTWYLKVNRSSSAADGSFVVNVNRNQARDFIQEGTTQSPVPLAIGEDHDGTVGHYYHSYSYYSFTTTESGVYRVTLSDISAGSLSGSLIRAPGFGAGVRSEYGTGPFFIEAGIDGPQTWYFAVYNSSEVSKTYSINVSRNRDYDPEGTVASPISVTLDTPLATKVEGAYGLTSSYYTFTAAQDGLYDLTASLLSQSCYFEVFSDPEFSTRVAAALGTTQGMTGKAFRAGTYYLAIQNIYETPDDFTLAISRTGDYPAEGSIASPVALTIGTPVSAKVGSSDSGAYYSYYAFTVTSEGAYAIQASGLTGNLDFDLYANADFTNLITESYSTTGIAARTYAAGTYYLRTYSSRSANSAYTLTIVHP